MLCKATSNSGECGCRAALVHLKDGIRDADLVRLEPHELMEHRSSAVLLKGTLHTSGRASYVPPAANSHTSLQRASMDHGNGTGTALLHSHSSACTAHNPILLHAWPTITGHADARVVLSTLGDLAVKRLLGKPSGALHVQGPSAATGMQRPAHRRSTRRARAPLEMWRTLGRGRSPPAHG